MKHFMQRTVAFLENTLGLNYLSVNFKKFSAMHCCYNLFQGMVGVYITTLLMRVSGDGNIVKWYNIINYLFTGFMMPVGVFVMRKYTTNLVTRIGIVGFIVVYAILLINMDFADTLMPLLAVLNGTASAFYWLTYSSYVSAFTVDNRRDVALAFIGFVNGIITLIMPALTGVIIEKIGGYLGYIVVFSLSFLVAGVTILLSFRLPKHINPQKNRETYFKKALRNVFVDGCWRCGMLTETIRGFRDGAFAFLLNLLLFETVESESIVGLNTLLVGIGTILSFYVVGKVVNPRNRVKSMLVATIVLLVAAIPLAFVLNPVTIIAFAFVNAFFSTFIANPAGSVVFLLVQKKSERESREEYFSIKDMFLAVGRIIGILLLMVFPEGQMGYVAGIIALTVTQFVVAGMSHHTLNLLSKIPEEEPALERTAQTE